MFEEALQTTCVNMVSRYRTTLNYLNKQNLSTSTGVM